jgi:GNAT superfamily N-acetyltransferase/acyl carrier protein
VDGEEIRRAILAAIGAIAPDADLQRVAHDRPLRDEIDLDSLDWINLVAALRDRLAVDISESGADRPATVDAIVAHVVARQAQPRATASPSRPRRRPRLPRFRCLVKGTPVAVRPMRADDVTREADFVRHLSPETRYNRFMVAMGELPQAKLRYFTQVDQDHHVALVATARRGRHAVIVAVARYIVDAAGTGCEFAIAVDDAWQGSGMAGILMQALIDVARTRGLRSMEGLVLRTNSRMLKFTRQLGFAPRHDPEDRDTVRVVRPL